MSQTKEFDCIEMKRRGALALHEKLAAMNADERLAYFARRSQELRELQRKLRAEAGLDPVPERADQD
jgi:hypothetical protein